MATNYSSIVIKSPIAGNNVVSGTEASTPGFAVSGTGRYTGPAPASGDKVNVTLAFTGGITQTSPATVSNVVGQGSRSFNWTLTSRNLSSTPLDSGSATVKVASFGGSATPSSPPVTFAFSPCYVRGTHILTSAGEVPVESLAVADLVVTASGTVRPIKWIGRRQIDVERHPRPAMVAPIRIRRDAFDKNVPHRDLLVSPDHAIYIDGNLIAARQLINATTILPEENCKSVEYFHVELETHDILLAEGLAAESYLNTGNGGLFAKADAPLILHPDLADEADWPTRETGSCFPFVWASLSVQPVWQRLADRAAVLGYAAPRQEIDSDPNLHLTANGKVLWPVFHKDGRFTFVLPAGTTEVHVVSRAAPANEASPWMTDQRYLGVALSRIVLHAGGGECWAIPVDHPALTDGWWAPERDEKSLWRWTCGRALILLPATGDAATLEINVVSSVTYVTGRSEKSCAA
jgi:hypothetical protein